ncbi:helix-turn-helix transcriptional regulator [Paenibacillus hunanensis]|uniref:helix-turn-helix transcriptional regulator n=1 Tax=Paenibacillus hunanensis TaxID=539262 RepID=UPI002A6B205C|nr:helix-turn-helix transcriptional regulator [Paenibacillus hunanensis]WPP41314.1 helix-turn-helix transcriptional regulator [Paenibacillus hunanensis]
MKLQRSSSALGEFIRSRRERIQPAHAGIQPLPGRRRTPGLRREEVAYLANVSVTYYTWLEQGKETNPSPEVLDSISNALRLDDDEREYMRSLIAIHDTDPLTASLPPQRNADFLQSLVQQLHYPSFITNEASDVITWNRAAELVIADFAQMDEQDRYMLNVIFLNEDYRKKLLNWDDFARYSVGIMRAGFERHRDNPLYVERFNRLYRESSVFAELWDQFEIRQKRVSTATYVLADGQEMEFEIHSASAIDSDPGLHWCFFVPSSETASKLTLLLEQDRLARL